LEQFKLESKNKYGEKESEFGVLKKEYDSYVAKSRALEKWERELETKNQEVKIE